MNIRNCTNNQFAELMGDDATDNNARIMRGMLLDLGFDDTSKIHDAVWMDLLIATAKKTAAQVAA